jgi:uncharacterized membrane protein YebE (DUF533 family)
MIITTCDSMTNRSGVSIDPTNPVQMAYAGAAVVGATVVVGSVAVTTIAAPGLVLVPGAIAGGLVAYAVHTNNNRNNASTDASDTPVAV